MHMKRLSSQELRRVTLKFTNKVIRKTVPFTAVVWPTSLWKLNQQTPGILVLTSYQNIDMFSI